MRPLTRHLTSQLFSVNEAVIRQCHPVEVHCDVGFQLVNFQVPSMNPVFYFVFLYVCHYYCMSIHHGMPHGIPAIMLMSVISLCSK